MKYVINSYEVSVATGMSHRNLLRKIRGSKKDIGIIQRIEELGENVDDYLKLAGNVDGNGKMGNCYLFTELGFNFLLNTFIGDRGYRLSNYYARKTGCKTGERKEKS